MAEENEAAVFQLQSAAIPNQRLNHYRTKRPNESLAHPDLLCNIYKMKLRIVNYVTFIMESADRCRDIRRLEGR